MLHLIFPVTKKKKILLILIIALILRLWGLNAESYWLDEVISLRQAQPSLEIGLEYVKEDVHLPFYISLLHCWIRLFGLSEISTRMMSVLFGVLSVLMMYLIGKKIFGQKVGLISALLASLSPLLIYYSQEARLYALFMFLTLVSFYMLILLIKNSEKRYYLLYAISTILLLYTQMFSFLVIASQNLYVLLIKKIDKAWIFTQTVLVISFLPWASVLLIQVSKTVNTSWISRPTIASIFLTFGEFLDLSALVLVAATVISVKKLDRRILLPVLWIIVPFTAIFLVSMFKPIYHTRYMLFTLPAVLLVFGRVIDVQKKRIKYGILVLIIGLSLFSIVNQISSTEKDDWRSLSKFLDDYDEPIFVDPYYHQDPLTYYFNPACFEESDLYTCNYETRKIVSLNWQAVCCSNSTMTTAFQPLQYFSDNQIWMISVRPEMLHNNSLFGYFSSNRELVKLEEFNGIKLYLFDKIN